MSTIVGRSSQPGALPSRAPADAVLTRRELARRGAPFVFVAVVGFSSLALPPYGHRLPFVVLAVLLAAVAVAIESLPGAQSTTAAGLPGPVIFAVAVGVAQYSSGAARSGLVALLALPILWSAIYRRRIVTRVLAVTVAIVFLAPLVAIGSPQYSVSDWRRAVVWCLIALVIAPVIQAVVHDLHEERSQHARAVDHLDSVLRAAISHSIIATDVDGLITTFNRGAERMLGYRAEDVVGIHTPDLFHDPAEVAGRAVELGIKPGLDVFAAAARGDTNESLEWTYLTLTGDRIPVRLTVSAMRDTDGELEGYIGVAMDIRAEKAALAAVETSERRWRILLDHLPDTSVLVVDSDMRYQVAVGAGLKRQGWNDMAGKTLFETSSPANMVTLESLYRMGLTGSGKIIEITSTNTGLLTQVEVVPLIGEDGSREALVVARDVTEARQTALALALHDSEKRFRFAFDTAPIGMLMVDLTEARAGAILQANPSMSRYTGYTEDALRTMTLDTLADPQDSAALCSMLLTLINGDQDSVQGEVRFRLLDATILWAQLALSAVRPEDGSDSYAVCLLEDITARKAEESALLHQSLHDPLTGLANRNLLRDRVEHALLAATRSAEPVGLLYLDLDGFKQVNDSAGHAAGDELLVKAANRLRQVVRPGDTVARLGGDEFAVVCTNMPDVATLQAVADRALDSLASPYLLTSGLQHVTASIGMSLSSECTGADQLLAEADTAMYTAKRAGKNRVGVSRSAPGTQR